MNLRNLVVGSFLCGISSTITFAQDSLISVIAEPGDGVYSLLRKHGLNPSDNWANFMELNAAKLKDGDQLYSGYAYVLPRFGTPANSTDSVFETPNSYPIFGPAYASVEVEGNDLKNAVIYLVSGHGGPDPGAVTSYGNTQISEDEYAYDVTLRLARKLITQGALVYVIVRDPNDGIRDTRILEMDKDEVVFPDLAIPHGQLARLKQRAEAVNTLYRKHGGAYQRLIVTHVDSRSKGQNIDVFFYHHEKSNSGKQLAENIHETFRQKYAKFQPNRLYTGTFEDRTTLYMVKNTLPPTAFIEIGNLRNTQDQKRILDPDNRQALANWIFEGILLDYKSR
ncbi:MAG: hypothetical protein RLZZ241_1414 [Bacteroidota bacterium]|jgi:N-acetylmuramoyl-L-alanine amidase